MKRGARFDTGEEIGTVNAFNHVHLNVGWPGEEFNPLLMRLAHFEDSVPPTIERGGVRLYDEQGQPFKQRVKGRLLIRGRVHTVVDAWDQVDGNAARRRLGLYRLGYQVLLADGTPAAGFENMRDTIVFNRLDAAPDAARIVYASGSGIPFYGRRRTQFLYAVTNTFRDGVAAPGVWDTSALPPGNVHAARARGRHSRQRSDREPGCPSHNRAMMARLGRPEGRLQPTTMSSDLLNLSAVDLLDLIASRRASPVEVTRAVLQRIETLNPVLNAFCFVAPDEALAMAAAFGSALDEGRTEGPARRRAGVDQGHPADQGLADAARLEDGRSRRAVDRRCAGGGAAARERRGAARQDHDAGVRLEGRHRQPAHRHHAQSVESGEDARRIVGRRRRGGRRRHGCR